MFRSQNFGRTSPLGTPSFRDRRLGLQISLVAGQQTEGVSVTNCGVTEETRERGREMRARRAECG